MTMQIRLEACTGKLVSVQHAGTDEATLLIARTPLEQWPYGLDWETFDVEPQSGGALALKCCGRYLSGQPNGTLECNRTEIAAWERWLPYRQGAVTTYQSEAHGTVIYVDIQQYKEELDPATGDVVWSGHVVALRNPEEWTFAVHTVGGLGGGGVVDIRPRQGLVHAGSGRMWADDHGEFYPLGGVLMNLLMWWRRDQAHARHNLEVLQNQLADYVRIFTSVDWGADLSVDPRWPDYDENFIRCVEACYTEYGLRIHLSVFAGADSWFGTDPTKYEAHCDRIGRLVAGREHMFLDKEAVNEASVTGIPSLMNVPRPTPMAAGLLERVARAVNTRIPIALSGATSDPPLAHEDRSKPQQVAPSLAWGCTTGIAQMARYATADGWDEALVPPWIWRRFPVHVHHNEPVGPGASSYAEYDPVRLATLRAAGLICGVGAFVLHNGAGISGVATPGDANHPPVPANLDEMQNIAAIAAALRGLDRWLPPQGTDGALVNGLLPGSMLECSTWRSGHGSDGAYAAYASVREPDVWAVLGGIWTAVTVKMNRAGQLQAYDIVDGLVWEGSFAAGDGLRLAPTALDEHDRGTLILRGTFTDANPMPPTPATTDDWHAWLDDVRARYALGHPDQMAQAVVDGQACYYNAEVQQNSAGDRRGRLYLPSPDPANPYACPVDFVNEYGDWTWIVRF